MAREVRIDCKTELGTTVTVKVSGGFGGVPAYGGGYLQGFTGHSGSLLSAGDMRAIAAALLTAAEQIEAAGLPAYQELRAAGRV